MIYLFFKRNNKQIIYLGKNIFEMLNYQNIMLLF
jgi:hypothetical protein